MRSNKCLVKAAQPICQSAVCALFRRPRMLLDEFAASGTLLAHLAVYQESQGLFCRAAPQSVSQSVRSLYCHQGLFFPSCRILYLFLLSVTRFLFAHSSSSSRSLWIAGLPWSILTGPLSFMESADLRRVHSRIGHSQSWMGHAIG